MTQGTNRLGLCLHHVIKTRSILGFMITLFKITALTAILPRIQNGTGAKPSGTSFTPCDHNEVNVRLQNDNKLGLARRQAVCLLFSSRDNNKVNVRFQNNNKLMLGFTRHQAVCHLCLNHVTAWGKGA